MTVSLAEVPHTVVSASSSGETLMVRNLQALILEGVQQLPASQQQFILDLVEFLLERSEIVGEDELPSAVECFRQGWEDVLQGNIVPIDQLWDGIDDE